MFVDGCAWRERIEEAKGADGNSLLYGGTETSKRGAMSSPPTCRRETDAVVDGLVDALGVTVMVVNARWREVACNGAVKMGW